MKRKFFLILWLAVANLFAEVTVGSPFAEGSRFWSVSAGRSNDPELGGTNLLQIHRNDYIADHLSLYYGMNFGYADPQHRPSGMQGGPEIGSRWHFAERQNWSAYLNGSMGFIFHEHAWTEESLHFNFDLQAGVGATRRVSPNLILKTEFGWHHLSNARVRGKGRNVGYDGLLLSVGLMRPF